jgi:hypothetical protein
MPDNNEKKHATRSVNGGYTPKGYVTQVINGQTVNIPVSKLKINPPKAGTAAIIPKQK